MKHPRFVKAQRDIFVKPVTPGCMRHHCRLMGEGERLELDACCRYGVDIDVGEPTPSAPMPGTSQLFCTPRPRATPPLPSFALQRANYAETRKRRTGCRTPVRE